MSTPFSTGPTPDSTAESASGPRRPVLDQRSHRSKTHPSPSLDSVPEDSLSHIRRPASLPHRSSSYMTLSTNGKDRAPMTAPHPRADYSESVQVKRKRSDWVVDPVEAQRGAEAWAERDRVILVLGKPTADLLAPILYDPAIAGTLLLVGSTEPLPSIEALLSPSHLLSNGPDQTIYPTLLPFVSPPGVDVAHSLESLLPHAINLAQQFRTRQNGSFRVWTDRHGSSDSVSSITPPGAPPAHLRKHSSLGLGEGIPRESWHSNWNGLSASPAFQPFSQKPDVRQSVSGPSLDRMRDISRPTPRSRLSSFTRNRITEADSKAAFSIRSPFDAVINFIPRASEFAPERALQDMLQQAVVVTTALLPLIARRTANTSREQGLPISLLHVLPTHIPRPLPAVVESFLLCFLPTFAHRGEREIWGSVITTTAWLMDRVGQPSRKPDSVGEMSGAEVLLFGGVRCLLKVLNDQSNVQEVKARAFLASWGSCLHIPGFFAVARRSPVKPQVQSPHHQYSSPPSSLCSDVHLRTRPSTTYEERLPATPMIRRLSRLVFAQDPSMPELDASQSSASSSSGFGDSNGSEQIEGTQVPQVHVAQKENRGFSGWFKRKSKMMTA